jgi:hypothetical protein
MGGFGSGGSNRRSVEEHRRRATFRADRHSRATDLLPAEFHADARRILERLLAAGDLFMSRAEKGGKNASKSLSAAAKCLTLAMSYSRLLKETTPAPPKDRLAAHLAKRAKVVPIRDPEHTKED